MVHQHIQQQGPLHRVVASKASYNIGRFKSRVTIHHIVPDFFGVQRSSALCGFVAWLFCTCLNWWKTSMDYHWTTKLLLILSFICPFPVWPICLVVFLYWSLTRKQGPFLRYKTSYACSTTGQLFVFLPLKCNQRSHSIWISFRCSVRPVPAALNIIYFGSFNVI